MVGPRVVYCVCVLQAAGCLTGGGVGLVPQALILSYMTMSVAVLRFMSKHSVVGKVSRAMYAPSDLQCFLYMYDVFNPVSGRLPEVFLANCLASVAMRYGACLCFAEVAAGITGATPYVLLTGSTKKVAIGFGRALMAGVQGSDDNKIVRSSAASTALSALNPLLYFMLCVLSVVSDQGQPVKHGVDVENLDGSGETTVTVNANVPPKGQAHQALTSDAKWEAAVAGLGKSNAGSLVRAAFQGTQPLRRPQGKHLLDVC